MAKYSVGIVKRELREIWSEYWERTEPTERAVTAAREGLLEQTVEVEADSATEAAALVERANPDSVVIPDAVQRIEEAVPPDGGAVEITIEGDGERP